MFSLPINSYIQVAFVRTEYIMRAKTTTTKDQRTTTKRKAMFRLTINSYINVAFGRREYVKGATTNQKPK